MSLIPPLTTMTAYLMTAIPTIACPEIIMVILIMVVDTITLIVNSMLLILMMYPMVSPKITTNPRNVLKTMTFLIKNLMVPSRTVDIMTKILNAAHLIVYP